MVNMCFLKRDLPFFRYVTIASACMATYRSGHIKENTVAMVPMHGYVSRVKHSADSLRWLDFVATTEKVRIQHAANGYGEKRIAGMSVDGFCEETNTVYQYHVSKYFFWHILCYFYIFF